MKNNFFSKFKIKKSYADILIFYLKNIYFIFVLKKMIQNIRKQIILNLNSARFSMFQHLQFDDFLVLEDFNFNY